VSVGWAKGAFGSSGDVVILSRSEERGTEPVRRIVRQARVRRVRARAREK